MYPEEFIYLPLYNNCGLTVDPVHILQPGCKNLLIADAIKENGDFRNKEEITLSSHIIQEFELNTLIKRTKVKISGLFLPCKRHLIIVPSSLNICGRLLFNFKKGCSLFYKILILNKKLQ